MKGKQQGKNLIMKVGKMNPAMKIGNGNRGKSAIKVSEKYLFLFF